MAAVRLDAGGAVDDGGVALIGREALGGVEVEQAVRVFLLWRSLAPPSPKPFNGRGFEQQLPLVHGCQRFKILFQIPFCHLYHGFEGGRLPREI